MTPVLPFRVREFNGANPHFALKPCLNAKNFGNINGAVIEHVRDGRALTPKGAKLLRQFVERPS